MAEYSKLAQGSFVCTAQQQVINLPFVPDHVMVKCQTGANYIAASTGTALSLEWNISMLQGDGIVYIKSGAISSGAPTGYYYPLGAITNFGAGSGITTFSAGLSFSYGPQQQISGFTKSTGPAVITTPNPHGYNNGDVVMFEGITGLNQIAGIPFTIGYISATTFNINANTSGSNYTAITSAITGAYVKKVNFPFLYAPGVSFVTAVTTGPTTAITTSAPHNMVVGQEVAFRIPPQWGITQLNSLPNVYIPGSPMYGYVISVPSSTTLVVAINSSSFTAFNSNPVYAPGLSFPQMVAVGDVNTGGWPITNASNLYPSPLVGGPTVALGGAPTINGPAIQGAFVNNTRQGFVIGSSLLTSGAVAGSSTYFWQARVSDMLMNNSFGVLVS